MEEQKSAPTIAVRTKEYALKLLQNFELLNVVPSKHDTNKLVYIFNRSEELLKAMDILIEEHKKSIGKDYMLNAKDVEILIGLLEMSPNMDAVHRSQLFKKLENRG